MNEQERFDRIVGLIYESVQDLPQTAHMLQAISDELGCVTGHYVVMELAQREVLTSYIAGAQFHGAEAEYNGHYCHLDPRLNPEHEVGRVSRR